MRIQKTFKHSLKKAQRKSPATSRRERKRVFLHARGGCRRSSFVKCSKYTSKQQQVSEKLEALKSLIPHRVDQNGSGGDDDADENEMVKAEQLFQETADYIIVLKTQVFVLQKLIEFYDGSKNNVKQNAQEESSS